MYVDKTRCTGCGACLGICPSGAMRLLEEKAQIDVALCNNCQTCVDVCPTGAIMAVLQTAISESHLTRVPVPLPHSMVETKGLTPHMRVIAPAISAALTFLGREVAPRVASAVVETMLNHATKRTGPQSTPSVRQDRQRRLRRRTRGTDR